MADEDETKLMEYVKSYQWQPLAVLLKDMGPARAERLVTSLVEREKHATALIVCARSSSSSSTTSPDSSSTTPRVQGDDSVSSGLLETCQVLVKYGADLNHRDRGGRTALQWAVGSGKAQLTALLLSLGADVGSTDNNGHTALHTAICAGNQPCVALLLQHDRQVLDEGDAHGTPPLTLAVQQGHIDICRQLLEAGADVTAQEVQTLRTPLHYALYLKHLDIFIMLLSFKPNLRVVDHRGTTVIHRCCAVQEADYLSHVLTSGSPDLATVINMEDNEGATPAIIACQNDNVASLQLLLDKGAKVDTMDMHGRTALHHCVENSDTGCAEQLLKTDPSLLSTTDGEGLTPLHMAVIAGNVPLIRLLLKRGASLQCRDQEEHSVAHWATVCGHCTVLDVLLEYGADLSAADKHQAYPIHYAAQMTKTIAKEESPGSHGTNGTDPNLLPDSTRLLKQLLANNVSPEVQDKDQRTPIIWAASAGNSEACRVLVEAGADVNSADKDGLSALHCAASRGHAECVRTLVSTCKARVDPADKNQCTPLFYATTLGHEECVKVLLDLGASPNHVDTRGRTTVHCAAVTGSHDTIEALGKQGVDLWQPTAKGDYPLHEAAQAGHVEIIEYLLQSKNDPNIVNLGNKDGRTCLHIAALTNNLWLAKFLLDQKANINAVMRNKGKKYTPYDAAVAKGNKEAAEYLLSRGGHTVSAVTSSAQEPDTKPKKAEPTKLNNSDNSAEKNSADKKGENFDYTKEHQLENDKEQNSDNNNEQKAEKEQVENSDKTKGQKAEKDKAQNSDETKGQKADKDKEQNSDETKGQKAEKDQEQRSERRQKKKSVEAKKDEKSLDKKTTTEDKTDVKNKDDYNDDGKPPTVNGQAQNAGQSPVPVIVGRESGRPSSGSSKKDKASSRKSSQSSDRPSEGRDKPSPVRTVAAEHTVNDHKEDSAKEETGDKRSKEVQPVIVAVKGDNTVPRKSESDAPKPKTVQKEKVKDSSGKGRNSEQTAEGSSKRKQSHDSLEKQTTTHTDPEQAKRTPDRKAFRKSPAIQTEPAHVPNGESCDEPSPHSSPATKSVNPAKEAEELSPITQKPANKEPVSSVDSPKACLGEVTSSDKDGAPAPVKGGNEASAKKPDAVTNKHPNKKGPRASTGKVKPSRANPSKTPETNNKTVHIKPTNASTTPQTQTSRQHQQERQRHQLQQQQQQKHQRQKRTNATQPPATVTRSRSRSSHSRTSSSSASSSRSRSRSRSPSRHRPDTMGSNLCRKQPAEHNDTSDRNDVDNLNLLSDNENNNTDHEEEEKDDVQDESSDRRDDQTTSDDQHDSFRDQRRRPKSSRVIANVQASVRRYEQERKSIRQLQQLRRAQIYTAHARNLELFHSLLQTYGSRNGATTWEQVLEGQHQAGDSEHRGKTNEKLSDRSESNDSVAVNKDLKPRIKSGGNILLDAEKTTPHPRRRAGAATALGINSSKEPRDNHHRRPINDSPRDNTANSPFRVTHLDFGDPTIYRQFQRQRTEEMHKLLVKAYKPAWPPGLLHNVKSAGGKTASSASSNGQPNSSSSKTPQPTAKSNSRASAGPQSSLNPESGQSTPSGMSHAQFRSVQRSYTIMTPYGSRRVRCDPDNPQSSTRKGPR